MQFLFCILLDVMSESVQKKLEKVRPPRIKITYDIETNGAYIAKELPGVFGIIGDFSGTRDPSKDFLDYKARKFIDIDSSNLNEVLSSLSPRVVVPINGEDGKEMSSVELFFTSICDFKPINLVKKIDILNQLYLQKKKLSEFKTKRDINKKSWNSIEKLVSDSGLQDTLQKQIETELSAMAQTATATPVNTSNAASTNTASTTNTTNNKTVATTDNLITAAGKELNDLIQLLNVSSLSQKEYLCKLIKNCIMILKGTIEAPVTAPATTPDAGKKAEESTAASDNKTTPAPAAAPTNGFKFTGKGFVELCNQFYLFVDQTMDLYLNQILQDKSFKKLESHWRGVEYTLSNVLYTSNTKIRLFNANQEEIMEDLTTSMEFDQSYLFKLIYEDEYGTLGGTPYTSIVWDFQLERTSPSFSILEKMTSIMAAAHCPLILGVSPSIFDLKCFSHLSEPHNISSIFDSVELSEFHAFRESDDSKYVTLVMPNVMARAPYNTNELPMEGLNFVEKVDPLDMDNYVWMNAAYAYFVKIVNSYANYGWFTSICGVENGGKIENLPMYIYKTAHGDYKAICPTEVSITDRRENELSNAGFIALCHSKNSNTAVIMSNTSAYKPPVYTKDSANANAMLSSETPYMLNVSRFAHYLKCMMRDKIGSFSSTTTIYAFLSNWLARYTLLDDKASAELKAEYPLREFSIEVSDVPGKPGFYNAILRLRPHDTLQSISISLRLVESLKG